MKLAAIDVGSNSIKLVVVDAAASDSFSVLAREKEIVRLGHDTLREKRLSPSATARAANTIARFRVLAESLGVERVFAIATASVRESANSAEFIAEVERVTGVRVEILSGIEEARLIGLAAARGCTSAAGAALLNIDIGGGSTEISLVRDGLPAQLFSIKIGAVGLTERFIVNDPAKPKELRALKEETRAALARPADELRDVRWQEATGTSGTILAIGEALKHFGSLRSAERSKSKAQAISATEIILSQLELFNERIAAMNTAQRRAVRGISAQRADIIIAGGHILEGAMRALAINHLRPCSWALREGVIIDSLREMESESRAPVPDIVDYKLRGALAAGRHFGYEEAHALQVARLAEKIFDALAAPYKLNRHQRTLLSAAALLHDTGYHIAHESHHKHALYLIKNSELTGFSEAERNVIANIARYHRGATPKERHPDYAALSQHDRETVCRLGAILRIADALDRSHDGRICDLHCAKNQGQPPQQIMRIQLRSAFDCEKELWAAEQKRDMFEQTFNCKLQFSVWHKRAKQRA